MANIKITFTYIKPGSNPPETIHQFWDPINHRLMDESIARSFAQHCLDVDEELYDFAVALASAPDYSATIDEALKPRVQRVVNDSIAWKRSILNGILQAAVPV